jgi:hypothetical protein
MAMLPPMTFEIISIAECGGAVRAFVPFLMPFFMVTIYMESISLRPECSSRLFLLELFQSIERLFAVFAFMTFLMCG